MSMVAKALVAFVALQHLGFLVLEMFLWRTPFGRKTFQLTEAFANESAPLAANQGLYNGFLAAGLVWSLVAADPAMAFALERFFLGCVCIAGLFGGFTASRSIWAVQMAPGLVALAAVFAAR